MSHVCVNFLVTEAHCTDMATPRCDQSADRVGIVIDGVGYVPMAEVRAEHLFQVIAYPAEKAVVILTTNCPSPNEPR